MTVCNSEKKIRMHADLERKPDENVLVGFLPPFALVWLSL